MFFDRYTTDTSQVLKALNKSDMGYCDFVNYNVSEEECLRYLEEVKSGQKANRIWNEERKRRRKKVLYWLICTSCFILLLIVPVGLYLWLDNQDSPWGLPICILASWGVIGLFVWLINVTDKYLNEMSAIYSTRFFPPVNVNVEKLFDDFLWKQYMRENKSIMNKKGQLSQI